MKFHIKDHHNQEEDGPDETCPYCGRQLMERTGILHRLHPISNAFVLNGHCLACHEKHCHSEAAKQRLAQPEVNKNVDEKMPRECAK